MEIPKSIAEPMRVILGKWVHHIRQKIQLQSLTLKHVKAHVGIKGKEVATTWARKANVSLPISPPQIPSHPFEVAHCQELMSYPHKTWTKNYIPTHKQADIWGGSFRPLKRNFRAWFRWLYACKWAQGFESYFTYWYPPNTPQHTKSKKQCLTCQ